MLHFLSQFDHFPRGRKDGLVSLLLPEIDIETTVRILADEESGLPFRP
jgi:hypothetical protein